jgi:hypothetical protein
VRTERSLDSLWPNAAVFGFLSCPDTKRKREGFMQRYSDKPSSLITLHGQNSTRYPTAKGDGSIAYLVESCHSSDLSDSDLIDVLLFRRGRALVVAAV